jgi:hypothetical protein
MSRIVTFLVILNLGLGAVMAASLAIGPLRPAKRVPVDDADCALRTDGSFALSSVPGEWTEACLYEIQDWSKRKAKVEFPGFMLDDSYVVSLALRGPSGETQIPLWTAARHPGEPNCRPVTPQTKLVRRGQWRSTVVLGLD